MPVYNVEKYISKCIISILNQTYKNFELLIINDGSLDNSSKIAYTFIENDQRISIFNKKNGGLSDARNFGLLKAKGEFIYFIDSDDWIEANLIESAVKCIEITKSDLLIFGYFLDFEDENGIITKRAKFNPSYKLLENKTFPENFLSKNNMNLLGYAWNKLYRKDIIIKYNLSFDKDISLVEDILFNSKIFEVIDNVQFLDMPLYHYIHRPSPTLLKTFHENSFELILLKHNSLKCLFKNWNLTTEKANRILADNLISGISYCLINMFKYGGNMSYSIKYRYIFDMVHNKEVEKYILFFKPLTPKEKLKKFLIKNKLTIILSLSNHFKN